MADVFENVQKPVQSASDIAQTSEQEKARLNSVSSLVNNRFPHKDYLAFASQQAGAKIEDLDEGWKGWAESQRKQFEYHRQSLTNKIVASQVNPEEVDEYISTLTALADETSIKKGGWDIQDIISLVKTSESLDKASMWQKVATDWKNKFMTGVDEGAAHQRMNDFKRLLLDLSGHNISPRPPIRSVEEINQLMGVFSETYGYIYSLPTEAKQKFISKQTVGDYTYEKCLLDGMVLNIVRLGLESHDHVQTRRVLELLQNQQVASETLGIFIDAVCHYGRNYGLTEKAVNGFQGKLLPALASGDNQVQILLRGGNIWAMRSGETMGIGDFICHCYATEINPPNINDLLLTVREVPTTDYARFEQNRLDALAAGRVFGALRDFIHDQRPGVSEVIQNMIEYYQTGDKSRLELLLVKTGGYLASSDRQTIILDRNNYEVEVEETVNGQKRKVKTIDVLRRLAENVKPIADILPVTSDAELNEKMTALMKSRPTSEATRELLGQAYNHINTRLIEMMNNGEIGVEPNIVLALAWLERRGFDVLQKLTHEDQIGVYKQKWFHSLLRFQELTTSPNNYDHAEFQSFLDQITQAESDKEAYRLAGRRVLDNIDILARKYKTEGKSERTGALWSGNIAHEMIGLTDFRSAITAYGKKHREERLKPDQYKLRGD